MVLAVDPRHLTLLGKEQTLRILETLYSRGWASATEVAKELGIHVSTSQAYLEGLVAGGLIQSQLRAGRVALTEYALADPILEIRVDLPRIAEIKGAEAVQQAKWLFVREKGRKRVSFEWDESSKRMLALQVLKKSRSLGRVAVDRTIRLTEAEGRWLWHLPQSTEEPKTVLQLFHLAGLSNPSDLLRILDLTAMLADQGIIAAKQGRE